MAVDMDKLEKAMSKTGVGKPVHWALRIGYNRKQHPEKVKTWKEVLTFAMIPLYPKLSFKEIQNMVENESYNQTEVLKKAFLKLGKIGKKTQK